MKRKRITSGRHRTACLEKAELDGSNAPADMTCQDMEPLKSFNEQRIDLQKAYACRRDRIAERNQLKGALALAICDFREALKKRNRRLCLRLGVLEYYRCGHGELGRRMDDLIAMGYGLINGEVLARAARYPAMSNPTINEVADCLVLFTGKALLVHGVDLTYQRAQAIVRKLCEEIDMLIKNLYAELRKSLKDLDPKARRRIMRRYGFKSIEDWEQPDPDEDLEPGLLQSA